MHEESPRTIKVKAFLTEIQEVCDRFQLKLVPFIEHGKDGSLNPKFTVSDTLPFKPTPPKAVDPVQTTHPSTPRESTQENSDGGSGTPPTS